MRCPFRFGRFVSEKDEACQEDCALRVEIDVAGNYGARYSVIACALAECGKPMNHEREPRGAE